MLNPDALYPYQQTGAAWLAERVVGLLADRPGLGKTRQAIGAWEHLGLEKVLVLCPAIACSQWAQEIAEVSPSRDIRRLYASRECIQTDGPHARICSYDMAIRSEIANALTGVMWDVVVLDEAHYLQNRTTKRTKLCFAQLKMHRLWAITGTPARNNAADLFPLMKKFGQWTGNYWEFVETFCATVNTGFGVQIVGSKNIDRLKRLLEPVMLRRSLEDVEMELPPMMFVSVPVEPGKVDIKAHFKESVKDVEAEIRSQTAMLESLIDGTRGLARDAVDALAPLQGPATTSLRKFVGLQKVAPVVRQLKDDFIEGRIEKIVLFAWHRDVLEQLTTQLADYGAACIYGGTSSKMRDSIQRGFKLNPQKRVLVCQIAAAGTAINLAHCSEIAFVESSYVPADNAQAALRVHRIGQTRPVRCRFFYVPDTIDDKIQKVLRRKTNDILKFVDADGVALTYHQPINPFMEELPA